MMTTMDIQPIGYQGQTASQRKNGGGVGRSQQSFWKHNAIRRAMHRQIPVLKKRGRGLIIDMHAGDGKSTYHPQPDLWAGGALITTPHLALQSAKFADIWLCEKGRAAYPALRAGYGQQATRLYRNHRKLLDALDDIAAAPWVLVLNDPNGPSDHGVEVMQAIAKANPCSDFVVVVNVLAIRRVLGVGKKDNSANAFALAVEASQESYAWMLSPSLWAKRLSKRQYLATDPKWISEGMTARILLLSNYIPGVSK